MARRACALVVTVAVLVTLTQAVSPRQAVAAGTLLFQNSFGNRTVDGTGSVTKPVPASGTNRACLTAKGNTSTGPLLSCTGDIDNQGSGKLRFTNAANAQVGAVFADTSFPTSNGLDVTFNTYQWGGTGADGVGFMLGAIDPANPAPPASVGSPGGTLGYAASGTSNGLANAYLGVGLDVYGNFSAADIAGGTGCTNPPYIGTTTPGAVVVRGPGNLRAGYCGLATSYNGTTASRMNLRGSTRDASVVPVQVLINPTITPYLSATGVTVSPGTYKVVVTGIGQTARTLTGSLPSVPAGLYPSTSWLNAGGVPKQLAFGFFGSTGAVNDVHEISDVKVLSFTPVPQLSVSTTSYAASTSQPGDPVTYRISTSVQTMPELNPVSVTQTVPAGVVLAGAYGSGWVCQPPSGRTVTCTTSSGGFPAGTTLPPIIVVAIVTTAGVTAATVQSGSPTGATSADADPGTDTTATGGNRPQAPSGLVLTPSTGSVNGGGTVTISGSNITGATAIEIGTTAEQQAGTPVTLFPCSGGATTGCFNVSGSTLIIPAMPARASPTTVGVTVVTDGIAATANYVYADKPAAPAAPSATAGVTSATVSWAAPANNGSPITGYVVSRYLDGTLQGTTNYDASTTTRTLSGLTAGGSYTFTVAAVNAFGTSTASPPSAAVVPYAVPAAPSVTAATAGTLSATLTWTTPDNHGRPITGYVVTPYIGTTAQPSQTFTGTETTRTVTGLAAGTTYTFTVAAQNLAGTGPPSAASPAVTPNRSPSLNFPAPPSGEVAVPYSRQLTVTDGTAPYTWSVSAGSLPPGLTLNPSSGLLSGTPTTAGAYSFTVQVVDAGGQTATRAVTLTIAAQPSIAFSPADGEVGVAYSRQPVLTGGTAPFAWSISSGSLPAGLSFNTSTGLISGTPAAAGSFPVTVSVTDGFGQTANRAVTLVIVPRPAFTATTPPGGQVGVAYSHPLAVTGGAQPLTWSLTAGSLPPGLSLNSSTGQLSGTPTTVGTYPFTVTVTDANGQTANKQVSLVIAPGPIVITKSANVSSAVPGSAVAYTITVANTGSSAFSASLEDPLDGVLDDAGYAGNATASSGTLTYTAPTLRWNGTVAAGATVTIAYSVTVANPAAGNKVLANTVTSPTLGTNCAASSTDSRCTATVTVPGLTIVKSADTATTTPGSTVRFTIVATNSGKTPYADATFTDDLDGVLDDATYNGDVTDTTGATVYENSLTWTGALAPGASVTVTYTVTANNPPTGDRSLTGTVVSPTPGSTCPGSNPAAACTATVAVRVPALSINNSVNRSTASPGDTVTFTVTLANTGQTAYTGAQVSVSLADALDDATYNGDATATAGSVTYGQSALRWTGDLAIGATVVVTASMTVRNPAQGDHTLTSVASSAAAGSTCPAGAPRPACTAAVPIQIPALTVTTAADVATTTPGSVVRYTVTLANTGQTAYTGATAAATLGGILDDATYRNDVAATRGSASVSAAALNWTGDLPVGASATITYSVTVKDPATGNRSLTTTASSPATGSTCPPGSPGPGCTSTVAVLLPGLAITMTADAATTTPGSVVRYTVGIENTGQTSYQGLGVTIDLDDALDDADYGYDASFTAGSLTTNPDRTLTWTGSLAPGARATGTLSLTVKSPAAGDRQLGAVIVAEAAGSNCRTGSADPSCRPVVAVLIPGLTITKTPSTTTTGPGGTVGYTISVHNDGETAHPAANVTDDLTRVLTDSTYGGNAVATTGTLSYVDSVLRWTGALAPGATATITYSVTVKDPDPGDKAMTNTAVSTTAGNNCPAGGTDPRCTALVRVLVPGLTLTQSASDTSTAPGATVGLTVTATNSGATPLSGTEFDLDLSGALDDAVLAGTSASTGTVAVQNGTLTWTGNLALGASATVTVSLTVRAADVGDDRVTAVASSDVHGDNNCAAGSTDTRCTTSVPVARLDLELNLSQPTATPGSVLTLSATLTNTGQVPYNGISGYTSRADTADDAYPTGDQTASSGTLSITSTAIVWTGSIPVGGTVYLSGTLVVKDPPTGNKLLTTTIVSSVPGSNCLAGSADARCKASTTVLEPGLTISTSASATGAAPGETVGYTVTIDNTGETSYANAAATISLAGVLDKAAYNGDAAATAGTVSPAGQNLAWSGPVGVGEQVVITYSVTVDADAASGDKTLVTSVSSADEGSTCPPSSGNTACRSTVVVLTPGLTITKSASTAHATLGSSVVFTVTVTNTGQTSYSAAAFDDPLAAVLDDANYDGDAAATAGTVGVAGDVVQWSGALAPGATATVTYTVTVRSPASGDGDMRGTVTSPAAGVNCDSGGTDSRCTTAVPVVNSVSLTFDKDADVAVAAAGDEVGYTIVVTNADASAITGVELTDDLADVLDDAAYNGDATADAGVVSLVGDSLEWTGDLPSGGTVTIRYSVTVDAVATGDGRLTGAVSSPTRPDSNNCTAGSTDPRCTGGVVTVASLDIEQAYETTAAAPGSVVRLTATFANTGTTPYEGISITSPTGGALDDATPNGDQAASSGTIVMSQSAITWTGDIPVGGVVTVTGTVTIQDTPDGDQELTGTLVTGAPGSNCPPGGSDPRCTAQLTILQPGLTITKSADRTFTRPGGTVAYTITVANTGETTYPGATVVSSMAGVLDDANYNGDATASTGSVSYSAPELTWTGALAPGGTATFTYSVTAQRPATGDKAMVDTVSSDDAGSNCPPASAAPVCRATVAVLTPALTIETTAAGSTAEAGGTATFTITATNTGQLAYLPASLEADLGDVLDDAGFGTGPTATTGTAGITGETLTWQGNLAPGGTVTITYSVTVDQPDEGDHRLGQTVTSDDDGSNCPAAGTDPRCSVTVPVADLRIANTTDSSTASPGTTVRITVTITNAGQVPYAGITVTDSLLGVVGEAVYNGDATATSGTLRLVPETVRVEWTGDVPVGGTVVITGSMTIVESPGGDQNADTLVTTEAPGSTCPASDPEPVCATSVPVLTPGLTIVKSADTATTTPGSTVGYTIVIANTGETAYPGATVTDPLTSVLDDAGYNGDAQATIGLAGLTGETLAWTGDLAVGETAIVTYSVTVDDPNPGDNTLLNTVRSAETGSSCPEGTANPDCRALVSVLTPALDIAVTADSSTTTPGSSVTYTVTIGNTGQTGYTAATVTTSLAGVLDDAAYGGGAFATTGTVTYAAPELTWTGDLAVGESAVVVYAVTVGDPATGDRDLATTVTSPAAGSSCGDSPQCTDSVAVLLPGLAITAAASRATVTPGDEVTFTLTIANAGETPYTAAVAAAALADVLDDADLTGAVTATRGEATYASGSVSWTGDLPAGATALVRFTVTVADPDPGDRSLSATVESAEVGSTCPAGGDDPDCTATVAVLVPALDVMKSASLPTVAPGGTVDYTIVVANTGETPYTGATVEDSLAGVLTNADYGEDATVDGGGTLTVDGQVLSWTGDLPVGATAVITYSVTVHDAVTGDRLLVNTATSSTRGSTCPPDDPPGPCTATVRVLEPGLTITKSADTSAAVAGDRVRYTVTVANDGEVPYLPATFADPLADVLDDGAYGGDAAATTGTVSYADATLTWSGGLDVGETATVTYSVVTREPAIGDRLLVNSVRSASAAASCVTGAEDGCTTSVPVRVPALTIVKAADVTTALAGKRVTYTVTATNVGEAPYHAAGLTDSLRGVLDDARYRGDAAASTGRLSYSDGLLRWTGGLAVGASVVITYSVTATGTGDGVLANHVTSGSRGSTCPVGGADVRCDTSTPVAGGPATGSPSPSPPPPDGGLGGTDGSDGGPGGGSTITLTDLTQAFRLTGMPGSTVTANEAVTMFVTTDDPGGYVVTVRGTGPALTADPGNEAAIPIGRLLVRESGTGRFRPLSADEAVVVHRQSGPSWPSGDPVGNDYRVDIPYLPADTYTTTLEYVVSTQ